MVKPIARVPVRAWEVRLGGLTDALLEPGGEWDRLLAHSRSNTVFMASGWLRAWSETLGRGARVCVPQVWIEGRLAAAAAFAEEDGVVRFAARERSDYADILLHAALDPSEARRCIAALLDEAARWAPGFRCFRLERIREDSPTLAHLASLRPRYYATHVNGVIAPFMDMVCVDERLRKKSLRRHERGLERIGRVTAETASRARDIAPSLDEFFAQHIARWAGTGTPSLFTQEGNREFYRRVTASFDPTGDLRFTTLRLDGALVAAHFGFMRDGVFTWYKPTFDPALAKLSPGEVLIKRLLELAKQEHARIFDFTIGDEAFKLRFATAQVRVVNVHISRSRLEAFARSLRNQGRTWITAVASVL